MELKSSEGMDLSVSGINLGFENPIKRMEECGANIEGVPLRWSKYSRMEQVKLHGIKTN